ncbi:hypothetical protein So717_00810 [Roseobacter cerasinus]|uniref:DUF2059 domain-containing protein n=1 Tax=Roseobacter cerasinus TaxID=2602289 RepID=A0A640VIG9_9RHOB|nr:DUF2059 domain-containing protein [Roseobacter cerasinus]GFE48328.1 hypothetical protein So717_00810 [Roseobacter cerasinus]
MTALIRRSAPILLAGLVFMAALLPARAADLDRLEAFLEVTGFDVALESIKLTAETAPSMIGLEANDFGAQWTMLVEDVFEVEQMHGMALDILSQTLEDDLLTHAVDFYASDLGQRLVVAENASHMTEDDALKSEAGEAIVAGLVQLGSPRLEELKRLNAATGSEDAAIRAVQEVQVRFLMAAAGAGVIELQMDETDLRETLKTQEGEMRRNMQVSALSGSAYTYQAFSDDDITAYADALEDPKMRQVYELMNAVQFEIMANRYEAVAARMSQLRPSQDL